MLLPLLLLVPAVLAFDSTFKYGCRSGKCTYQFVVPKQVAQIIDQQTLSNEIAQISQSISTLSATIDNFSDANTTDFTTKFNDQFSPVNQTAQDLSGSVANAQTNSANLVTASANANQTANLIYNAISCFKNTTLSSYTCFTAPTTVAPTTTNVVQTTVTQVTGGASTVPFTGSTVSGEPQTTVTGNSAGPASTSASNTGSTVSGSGSEPEEEF